MAVFRPFQALRPKRQMAQQTAALPYDVMNEEEAREMTEEAPLSFLHIDRAEVDFPRGVDPYSQDVYQKAAENLNRLEQEGVYVQDPVPGFYLYREKKGNSVQTGIVGCASVEDYENDVIRKHELTRKEKEEDRIRHVAACQAHTGPIFLTCPYPEELKKIVAEWIDSHEPEYDWWMTGNSAGGSRKSCSRCLPCILQTAITAPLRLSGWGRKCGRPEERHIRAKKNLIIFCRFFFRQRS